MFNNSGVEPLCRLFLPKVYLQLEPYYASALATRSVRVEPSTLYTLLYSTLIGNVKA